MRWEEIRACHPNQWLIVEALEAHPEGHRRLMDRIGVIETCPERATAFRRYRDLHVAHPAREFYFVHTVNPVLEIKGAHGWASVGIMNLTLRDNLPFLTITISHKGLSLDVTDVLVDTGSASTVFSADALDPLGIEPEPTDILRALRGIGGRELVYSRRVDRVAIGANGVDNFPIEVAGMNYGFAIKAFSA